MICTICRSEDGEASRRTSGALRVLCRGCHAIYEITQEAEGFITSESDERREAARDRLRPILRAANRHQKVLCVDVGWIQDVLGLWS